MNAPQALFNDTISSDVASQSRDNESEISDAVSNMLSINKGILSPMMNYNNKNVSTSIAVTPNISRRSSRRISGAILFNSSILKRYTQMTLAEMRDVVAKLLYQPDPESLHKVFNYIYPNDFANFVQYGPNQEIIATKLKKIRYVTYDILFEDDNMFGEYEYILDDNGSNTISSKTSLEGSTSNYKEDYIKSPQINMSEHLNVSSIVSTENKNIGFRERNINKKNITKKYNSTYIAKNGEKIQNTPKKFVEYSGCTTEITIPEWPSFVKTVINWKECFIKFEPCGKMCENFELFFKQYNLERSKTCFCKICLDRIKKQESQAMDNWLGLDSTIRKDRYIPYANQGCEIKCVTQPKDKKKHNKQNLDSDVIGIPNMIGNKDSLDNLDGMEKLFDNNPIANASIGIKISEKQFMPDINSIITGEASKYLLKDSTVVFDLYIHSPVAIQIASQLSQRVNIYRSWTWRSSSPLLRDALRWPELLEKLGSGQNGSFLGLPVAATCFYDLRKKKKIFIRNRKFADLCRLSDILNGYNNVLMVNDATNKIEEEKNESSDGWNNLELGYLISAVDEYCTDELNDKNTTSEKLETSNIKITNNNYKKEKNQVSLIPTELNYLNKITPPIQDYIIDNDFIERDNRKETLDLLKNNYEKPVLKRVYERRDAMRPIPEISQNTKEKLFLDYAIIYQNIAREVNISSKSTDSKDFLLKILTTCISNGRINCPIDIFGNYTLRQSDGIFDEQFDEYLDMYSGCCQDSYLNLATINDNLASNLKNDVLSFALSDDIKIEHFTHKCQRFDQMYKIITNENGLSNIKNENLLISLSSDKMNCSIKIHKFMGTDLIITMKDFIEKMDRNVQRCLLTYFKFTLQESKEFLSFINNKTEEDSTVLHCDTVKDSQKKVSLYNDIYQKGYITFNEAINYQSRIINKQSKNNKLPQIDPEILKTPKKQVSDENEEVKSYEEDNDVYSMGESIAQMSPYWYSLLSPVVFEENEKVSIIDILLADASTEEELRNRIIEKEKEAEKERLQKEQQEILSSYSSIPVEIGVNEQQQEFSFIPKLTKTTYADTRVKLHKLTGASEYDRILGAIDRITFDDTSEVGMKIADFLYNFLKSLNDGNYETFNNAAQVVSDFMTDCLYTLTDPSNVYYDTFQKLQAISDESIFSGNLSPSEQQLPINEIALASLQRSIAGPPLFGELFKKCSLEHKKLDTIFYNICCLLSDSAELVKLNGGEYTTLQDIVKIPQKFRDINNFSACVNELADFDRAVIGDMTSSTYELCQVLINVNTLIVSTVNLCSSEGKQARAKSQQNSDTEKELNWIPLGAEDIQPIMMSVLIQSKPKKLISTLHMLAKVVPEEILCASEYGYYVTSLDQVKSGILVIYKDLLNKYKTKLADNGIAYKDAYPDYIELPHFNVFKLQNGNESENINIQEKYVEDNMSATPEFSVPPEIVTEEEKNV